MNNQYGSIEFFHHRDRDREMIKSKEIVEIIIEYLEKHGWLRDPHKEEDRVKYKEELEEKVSVYISENL